MAFFQRRKPIIFKIVFLVTVTWFLIIILLNISKNVVLNKRDQMYKGNYLKQSNVPIEEKILSAEDFIHLPINVPHFKDLSNDILSPLQNVPGEYGKAYRVYNLPEEDQNLVDEGWEQHAFNQYVSDRISLHRILPDVRPRGCRDSTFSKNLPVASVIICFHNEAWSVLMRTVHSILDRSPYHLIEEIILVDDYSSLEHLGKKLDDYVAKLHKVKVVRAQKREGLMRARMLGVSVAKSSALIFLDSHCECTSGWLEPLLQRIHRNKTTIAVPTIDVIDESTFEYYFKDSGEIMVGGFDWNLAFTWHVMPERQRIQRKHSWDPVWSPTMPGGLFAINKEFFEKLGGYDSGFEIWGGENLELSFKTWMCGGSLEIVPCSHIGHVFRYKIPYSRDNGPMAARKNTVRVAEVWLDEYKQYFYNRLGPYLTDWILKSGIGDITSRKELRTSLKCHSFDWYVKNVYPELFVPGDVAGKGEIRNLGLGSDTCLDDPGIPNSDTQVSLYPCHNEGGNQFWMLSRIGEIRKDEFCLDYNGDKFIVFKCHGTKGNQLWIYNHKTNTIMHGPTLECLEMTPDKQNLNVAYCNGNPRQLWLVEEFDPDKYDVKI